MGNQPAKTLDAACGMSFLHPDTLVQTSLQPISKRMPSPLLAARSPIKITTIDKNGQVNDKKDSPDQPETKSFCHSPRSHHDLNTVTENDFHIMQIMSSDKLGRVYLVKKNDNGNLYAMKTFCKRKVYSLDCIDSVDVEKNILEDAKHPFIPTIKYTFENDKRIFLITDYFEASELHNILVSLTRFSEEITRFYSAEILTVIEYLWKDLNIIFTDLKTEHILVDSHGHIKLANFEGAEYGIRKKYDFWHMGCLMYEMLTGSKPFTTENFDIKSLTLENLEENLHWSGSITVTAKDLVIRLLSGRIDETSGFSSFEEIKKHAFFAEVRWEKILNKQIYPPLSPSLYKKKNEKEQEVFTFKEEQKPSFVNFEAAPKIPAGLNAGRIKSMNVFDRELSTNDN